MTSFEAEEVTAAVVDIVVKSGRWMSQLPAIDISMKSMKYLSEWLSL